jgi:hypothetical protein
MVGHRRRRLARRCPEGAADRAAAAPPAVAARSRASAAIEARRTGLRWMMAASMVTATVAVPLGILHAALNLGAGLGDGLLGELVRAACFLSIAAGVGAAALAGVLAARREDVALHRLDGALTGLSLGEVEAVARELRSMEGDAHREALAVVHHRLAEASSALVPVAPPLPGNLEPAPAEPAR